MATTMLVTKQNSVSRQIETLQVKVGEESKDLDHDADLSFEPSRTTAWFYWSPSAGVRFYTFWCDKASTT